jgi:transposase
LEVIDWDRLGGLLAGYYSPDRGRPSEVPVRMLKLEFLRYHDNLSDRQVIARAETDIAYRFFLRLSMREPLPAPSSLCYFRGRLGLEGFRRVFRDLISQAREHGLVKDRLRIKDATHVIADVALPTTLALVAQVRDKLLGAAEPFEACRVAGERGNLEVLRASSAGRSLEERLAARVAHLREISACDNEGADAVELVREEEAAQGNDIAALSIDGAGFQGALLRELEDAEGLAADVYVPPKRAPEGERFGPEEFTEDRQREVVRCPAGEESRYRQRDSKHSVTIYRFARLTCMECPLRPRCLEKAPGAFGRTVRKNDYEAEHRRAREKATTPEYQAVRREHPKVERKLAEVMNRHGGRRARYRGRRKVLLQELMASTATNVKRMVRLLGARQPAARPEI